MYFAWESVKGGNKILYYYYYKCLSGLVSKKSQMIFRTDL